MTNQCVRIAALLPFHRMARTASAQQGISALTRCDVVTLVRREESNASIAHASGIDTFELAPMAEAAAAY
jgi:hypothetical protein